MSQSKSEPHIDPRRQTIETDKNISGFYQNDNAEVLRHDHSVFRAVMPFPSGSVAFISGGLLGDRQLNLDADEVRALRDYLNTLDL